MHRRPLTVRIFGVEYKEEQTVDSKAIVKLIIL